MKMAKFLTFGEAATQIGVHVKTLQKHARQGKLETVETPFGRRISESSLTPYLECLEFKGSSRSRLEPDGAERSELEPDEVDAEELLGVVRSQSESNGTVWSAPVAPAGAERSQLESSGASWSQPLEPSGVKGSHLESDGTVWSVEEPLPKEPEAVLGSSRLEKESVPLSAHLQALSLAQAALDRAQQAEVKVEEQRQRAELAERQRTALEVELSRYRIALEEQASSLMEVRAQAIAAEAQLSLAQSEVTSANCNPQSAVITASPGWGSRVKRWLGLKAG